MTRFWKTWFHRWFSFSFHRLQTCCQSSFFMRFCWIPSFFITAFPTVYAQENFIKPRGFFSWRVATITDLDEDNDQPGFGKCIVCILSWLWAVELFWDRLTSLSWRRCQRWSGVEWREWDRINVVCFRNVFWRFWRKFWQGCWICRVFFFREPEKTAWLGWVWCCSWGGSGVSVTFFIDWV